MCIRDRLFVAQMNNLRNWAPKVATAEWEQIVADTANYADEGGHARSRSRYFAKGNRCLLYTSDAADDM
eukprot:5968390-Alexandrium_andersonii.AAC.1